MSSEPQRDPYAALLSDLNPPDSDPFDLLDSEFQKTYGRPLRFTGRDTKTHIRLHGAGQARDIGVRELSGDELKFILKRGPELGLNLKDYSKARPHTTSTGVKITGPHVHAQRGKPKVGGNSADPYAAILSGPEAAQDPYAAIFAESGQQSAVASPDAPQAPASPTIFPAPDLSQGAAQASPQPLRTPNLVTDDLRAVRGLGADPATGGSGIVAPKNSPENVQRQAADAIEQMINEPDAPVAPLQKPTENIPKDIPTREDLAKQRLDLSILAMRQADSVLDLGYKEAQDVFNADVRRFNEAQAKQHPQADAGVHAFLPEPEAVNVEAGPAMSEPDTYRQWYEARRLGNIDAQREIASAYLKEFPATRDAEQLKRREAIERQTMRPISDEEAERVGAFANVPVSEILALKKSGLRSEKILKRIQDRVASSIGLSPWDVAVLTEKYGQHPLANIMETGGAAKSTVESIIRQGQSNLTPEEKKQGLGAADFNLDPEAVRDIRRALKLSRPQTEMAKAASQGSPHMRESYFETEQERKADPKGYLAYLKEAGPERAKRLLREATYDGHQVTEEEGTAAGLDREFWKPKNLATYTMTGAANVVGPALTIAGALSDVEGLENLGTQAVKVAQSESQMKGRGGFGQKTVEGFGSMVAFAATPGGAVGSGIMGALSSMGQAYQEMRDKGISRSDAKRLSLLFVPAGALEAFGVNQASILNQLKREGVKHLAKEVAKQFVKGGAKETLQELTQNVMTDWTAKGIYDPQRNVFDLPKLAETGAISFLLGGVMEGGARGVGGVIDERHAAKAERVEAPTRKGINLLDAQPGLPSGRPVIKPQEEPPSAEEADVLTETKSLSKLVQRFDDDPEFTANDLAQQLESRKDLPKKVRKALVAYRAAQTEDRADYGMRSGLPEEAEDSLLNTLRAAVSSNKKATAAEAPRLEVPAELRARAEALDLALNKATDDVQRRRIEKQINEVDKEIGAAMSNVTAGQRMAQELYKTPVKEGRVVAEEQARVPGVVGVVKRAREGERRARLEGAIDQQTKLQNKGQWLKAQPHAEADPNREIAVIDLNNLKAANDQFGHLVGDRYIEHAATVVREEAKKAGIPERDLFRVGGDELTLIGNKGKLAPVVKAIKARIAEFKHEDFVGGAAIGVAPTTKRADALAYVDKREMKRYQMKPEHRAEVRKFKGASAEAERMAVAARARLANVQAQEARAPIREEKTEARAKARPQTGAAAPTVQGQERTPVKTIVAAYEKQGALKASDKEIQAARNQYKGVRLNWESASTETATKLRVLRTNIEETVEHQESKRAEAVAEQKKNGPTAKATKLFDVANGLRQEVGRLLSAYREADAFGRVAEEKAQQQKQRKASKPAAPASAADAFSQALSIRLNEKRQSKAEQVKQAIRERAGAPKLYQREKQTDTPEFKKFFGKSKVVDGRGEPLVVYHGTGTDFDTFSESHIGSTYEEDTKGFFFTSNPREAADVASDASARDDEGAIIMPVFLSMRNPLEIETNTRASQTFDVKRQELIGRAEELGSDGIIIRTKVGDPRTPHPDILYVVFDSAQIKSAIGNRGTFDPNNPNILFQEGPKTYAEIALPLDIKQPLLEIAQSFLAEGNTDYAKLVNNFETLLGGDFEYVVDSLGAIVAHAENLERLRTAPSDKIDLAPGEATEKAIATGKTSHAVTPRGIEVKTRFALFESDQPITSHDIELRPNPHFPEGVQNRDRAKVSSEDDLNQKIQRFEPEYLGRSIEAGRGAPILGPDMAVESGNGRVIMLRRIYRDHPVDARKYRTWLEENAARFGLTRAQVEAMNQPILAQVRLTALSPAERIQFAEQANEDTQLKLSPVEVARGDARKLSAGLIAQFKPGADGDMLAASNREFVKGFLDQVVGPSRGDLLTSSGELNQSGVDRVRNAIFARAYADTDAGIQALEKLSEETDVNTKRVITAMVSVAPRFVELKQMITSGGRYALDLSPDLAEAARQLSLVRESGVTVDEFLRQGQLFGENLSRVQKKLLWTLNENARSAVKLGQVLTNYLDAVDAIGDPRQQSFFSENVPTKEEILEAAVRRISDADQSNIGSTAEKAIGGSREGLFAERPAPATGAEAAPTSSQPRAVAPKKEAAPAKPVVPTDRSSFKKALIDKFGYSEEVAHRTSEIMEGFASSYATDVKSADPKADVSKAKAAFYRAVQIGSGQTTTQILEQAGKTLIAIHNTTQRGILEAAKLGGIPVPSIAITRPEMKFTSHGDVTLIGNQPMIDPQADMRNKVYAADIYSGRQPRPSHPFKPRKLDDFSDRIQATGAVREIRSFDGYYDVADQIRDVKYGAEDIKLDVYRELSRDMIVQLAFLRESGETVKVPQQAEKNYRGSKADLGKLRDILDKRIAARQVEFDAWLEKNTAPAFGEAYLQAGRKRVPYTLDNVLAAMVRPPRGREEGMTHSLGKARATAAKPLKTVEAMHKAEDTLAMPDDIKAFADETQRRFLEFQDQLKDRYKYPAAFQFDKLDDLSKALGDYLKGPKGRAGFERALARHDYDPSTLFDEVLDEGIAIAERLRETPTQYFEAKPQRAVRLGEFSGAVVPSDVQPKVLKALRDAGITDIRTYKSGDREDQAAKTAEFDNVLFQTARGATEFTRTGEAIIAALNSPNESTGVHELAHSVAPLFFRLASQPNAPATLKSAMRAMESFMGLADGEFLKLHEGWVSNTLSTEDAAKYRDGQEKNARGFEAYLREGNAPSKALRAAFEKFKEWLTAIYRRLKDSPIDVGLNYETVKAWDRLLGGEREAAALKIKEDEHWNFKRSSFASPQTEARFRAIVRNAAVESGGQHKVRVSREQHLERVAELSPDLLPEVKRLRESMIASREIFTAAAQYAQTLTNQAQQLRTQITPATLPDEALALEDKIAALEHDAEEIMAHTIGVRSEFGRNLALLATQKTDQLAPEKVLAFGKKLAESRGLERTSSTWKTAARKLVGLSNEIQGAQSEKKRIAKERKSVQEASVKKATKREPWQTVMLSSLKSQAKEASARLQKMYGPKLYQKGEYDITNFEPEQLPWSGELPVSRDFLANIDPGGRLSGIKVVDAKLIRRSEERTERAVVERLKRHIENLKNDLPPIVVERDADGLFVVDGHHRLLAAAELGYSKIPVREYLPPKDNTLYQLAGLTTEELDQVRAKFESLKRSAAGRPIKTVVDDYVRQLGLFGSEMSPAQQGALMELASPTRRAPLKAEQTALFETSPTIESRREQSEIDKAGPSNLLFQEGGQTDKTKLEQFIEEGEIPPGYWSNDEPIELVHGTLPVIHYSKEFPFAPKNIRPDAHDEPGLFVYPQGLDGGGGDPNWQERSGWRRPGNEFYIDPRFVEYVQTFPKGEIEGTPGETIELFIRGENLKYLGESWREAVALASQAKEETFDADSPNILFQREEHLPALARDIATILAARVAEESQTKGGLPLDRILEEMRSAFPDVIGQYEEQIKATADSLLKDARRQALVAAARDPETQVSARRQLALDVADSKRAERQTQEAADQRRRQIDKIWQHEAAKAEKEAAAAWDKSNAEWQKVQKETVAQGMLAEIQAERAFKQQEARARAEQQIAAEKLSAEEATKRLAEIDAAQAKERLQIDADLKAEAAAQKQFERDQRAAVLEEAKRISRAALEAEHARLQDLADEAREQMKADREAAREAQRDMGADARARRKAEREQAARKRRWDYPIIQAASEARDRIAQRGYTPTVEDIAAIAAGMRVEEGRTASPYQQLVAEFGDFYRRNAVAIRNRAAAMLSDARGGAAQRRLETKAAGRAEGATAPAAQAQAREDYAQWQAEELSRLAAEEAWQDKRIRNAKRDIAKEFAKLNKLPWWETAMDILSLPRSLITVIDLPHFRQGMPALFNHPKVWVESLVSTASTWTEAHMDQMVTAMENRPLTELAMISGLKLSGVESRRRPLSLIARQEEFQNRIAQMFPHVRLSERQYTIAMDIMRSRVFELHAEPLLAKFPPALHPEMYAEIARIVNILNGVGDLGRATQYTPILNRVVFFATRFMAARFQMLGMLRAPLFYRGQPWEVRRIAAKEAYLYAGKMSLMFALAHALGITSFDVDDDDFLKLNIPGTNQKWDITGGVGGYVKMLIKVARSSIRLGTGKKEFKGDSLGSTIVDFARGKLAPAPAVAVDLKMGSQITGEPVTWQSELAKNTVPMIAKDVYEAVKIDGARGLVMVPYAILGGNVSAFRSRKMPDRTGSEAERYATGMLREKMGSTPETPEEYKRRTLITELTAARKAGRPTERIEADLVKAGGPLTRKEQESFDERISQTPLERAYPHLDESQKQAVLDVASPSEKALIEPTAEAMKGRLKLLFQSDEYKSATTPERTEMMKRVASTVRQDKGDVETELNIQRDTVHDRLVERIKSSPQFQALDEDGRRRFMSSFGQRFARTFAVPKGVAEKLRTAQAEQKAKLLEIMSKPGDDGRSPLERTVDSALERVATKKAA